MRALEAKDSVSDAHQTDLSAKSRGGETQSLLKGLNLLETVAIHQPIGVGDLSRLLGVPKSSAQRVLTTLASANWLEKSADGQARWSLGSRSFSLTGTVGASADLRSSALPAMNALVAQVNETVHLSVPAAGLSATVLIERVECTRAIRSMHPVGTSFPLHCTASGKAFLAALPEDEIEEFFKRPFASFTDLTITSAAELRQEIAIVRDRGWSLNLGENQSEVAAIAAAVLDAERRPLATIAISMPRARFEEKDEEAYGRLVSEAAAQASQS